MQNYMTIDNFKIAVWTSEYSDPPCIAVNMTVAINVLEGYELTDEEKTDVTELMAGYCRLVEERNLTGYGETEFVDDVESGKKTQTIRKHAKSNPPKKGDELQLFTGMRTKYCRLLNTAICTNVTPIRIYPDFSEVHIKSHGEIYWVVFDSDNSLSKLATWDGFSSIESFLNYFRNQVNEEGFFEGFLIAWQVCDKNGQ